MTSMFARAAIGLALLVGVVTTQPVAVSAQGAGGELAHTCQDPDFREFVSFISVRLPGSRSRSTLLGSA